MAKIEHVERRLQNWARYKLGGKSGGLGYAHLDLTNDSGRDGYRESKIPTISCEAEETDSAVLALESQLRYCVEVWYLENQGIEQKAQKMCCTRQGVHARIDRAHSAIHRWLMDKQAMQKEARDKFIATTKNYLSLNS